MIKLFLLLLMCFSVYAEAGKQTLKALAGFEGYSEQPFSEWKKGDDEPSGLDPDLLRLLSKELNIKISFFRLDLSKGWVDVRREVLEAEIVDLVAYAYTATGERKKYVAFSKPYLISSMNALVLKGSKISSKKDLEKHPVLAFGHTTGFQWAKQNIKGKIYSGFPKGFQGTIPDLLRTKTVAAYIGDYENLVKMAETNPDLKVVKEPLQKEHICIALPKGRKQLLKRINKALDELEKNGELKKLRKKYFQSESDSRINKSESTEDNKKKK